jgi:hypothetical protein
MQRNNLNPPSDTTVNRNMLINTNLEIERIVRTRMDALGILEDYS